MVTRKIADYSSVLAEKTSVVKTQKNFNTASMYPPLFALTRDNSDAGAADNAFVNAMKAHKVVNLHTF
jgi:hypothetical protein